MVCEEKRLRTCLHHLSLTFQAPSLHAQLRIENLNRHLSSQSCDSQVIIEIPPTALFLLV